METSNSSGNNCSLSGKVPPPWEDFNTGKTAWHDFKPLQQDSIARHFAPKVKYLALRLKAKLPQNIELTELISAGTFGLMEAFIKFKPDLGNKFETYAENRIRGAMLDELRKLDWFPRSLRRRIRILDEATRKLEQGGHGSPSETDLCAETGLPLGEVREGLEAKQNQGCLSLDLFQDSLPSDDQPREGNPYTSLVFKQSVDKLSTLIDALTPREKMVLSLYYTEELNMRETAEIMGITEGRVSQLHSQALLRLRKEFDGCNGNTHAL